MSDENQDTPNNGDALGTGQSQDAGSSGDVLETLQAIAQRLSTLEGRVSAEQSNIDKAANRIAAQLPDQVQAYLRYTGQELDPDAWRNMQIDAMLAGAAGAQQQAGQPAAATGQPPPPSNLETLIQLAGLEPSDPAVLRVVAQAGNSQESLVAGLAEVKAQKLQGGQSDPPPAAAGSPTTGSPTASQASAEDLQAQFEAEMSKTPRGQVGIQARVQIMDKYRRLGLNV